MFHLLGKIPRRVGLAISGGRDSMVAYDFLNRNHDLVPIFFNHGTDFSQQAESFLIKRISNLQVGHISREKKPNESLEEYWRNQRYEFFHQFDHDIITMHHLDDCVETWIWSCLNGEGKLIPYRNQNVIRPFLMVNRSNIDDWAIRNNVEYLDDPSNRDIRFTRNYIRHELLPHALRINPGLHTMIRKKLKDQSESSSLR